MAATRTLAPVVSQSRSAIAVFPQPSPAVETLTQLELTALLSLKNRAEQLQSQIDEAEKNVQARLEAGAAVEAGLLKAYLKTTQRRNVSWKEVCERRLGASYCNRVLAATHPTPSTHLVVSA
jgi:hypothetical protein